MQGSKKTSKENTHRSEWRSALKKDLTGPTLLEMSGNPTYQELTSLPKDIPFPLAFDIAFALRRHYRGCSLWFSLV